MANKRNQKGSRRNTLRRTASPASRTSRMELEKREKQEKRKKTAKGIAIGLLVILLLTLLGFAGFGIAYVATDGFGGKVSTAVVIIDGEAYSQSAEGFSIFPGDEIGVQNLVGDTEYSVRIEASAAKKNFVFNLGEEPYTWKDLDGEDMTRGFAIEQTETGFTIGYESLPAIVSAVRMADATIAEDADLTGDLFVLIITIGETEYRFGFGIGLPVSGIEIDPDQIVIADGEAVPSDEPSGSDDPGEPDEPDEPSGPDGSGDSEETEQLSDSAKAFIRELVVASQTNDFQAAFRCLEAAAAHSKVLTEQDKQHPDIVKASQCFSTLMLAITDDYIYDETEREYLHNKLGDLVERYS